jgi:hypothetical protein
MIRLNPAAAAKWLGWAYVVAVALAMLWRTPYDDALTVLTMPFAIAWIISPVAAAALSAAASRTRIGAAVFLALQIGLIASSLWLVVDVEGSTSSTAGVAYIIWPAFQWGAWAGLFVLALICGWRAKESWLNV